MLVEAFFLVFSGGMGIMLYLTWIESMKNEVEWSSVTAFWKHKHLLLFLMLLLWWLLLLLLFLFLLLLLSFLVKFSALRGFQLAEIVWFDEKYSACNTQGEQCGRLILFTAQRRPADIENIYVSWDVSFSSNSWDSDGANGGKLCCVWEFILHSFPNTTLGIPSGTAASRERWRLGSRCDVMVTLMTRICMGPFFSPLIVLLAWLAPKRWNGFPCIPDTWTGHWRTWKGTISKGKWIIFQPAFCMG